MKRLLSIDDDPGIIECIRQSLHDQGYDITTATDPEEGIRLFETGDYDLILLDVNMPRITGFEVFRRIRAKRKVPVLFVTAYPRAFNPQSDEVIRMWQEEFADGTTDIVYKPFRLKLLIEKVEGLIGEADADNGS